VRPKGFKPLSLAFISAGLPGHPGKYPDGRGLLGNGSSKSGLPQGRYGVEMVAVVVVVVA